MKKFIAIILTLMLVCGAASAETFLDVARDYINDLYDEEVLATDVSAEEAFSEWEYDENSNVLFPFLLRYREGLINDEKSDSTLAILDTDETIMLPGIILYDKVSKKTYYINKPVDRLRFLIISTALKKAEEYSGEPFLIDYRFCREQYLGIVSLVYTEEQITYYITVNDDVLHIPRPAQWYTMCVMWTDGFMYGYYDDQCEVKPRYAIISVGENNLYGHPSETTLDRLSDVGATIYRTDINGTIICYSDGNSLTFELEKDFVEEEEITYIGNKNTKKLHYPSCSSVSDMKSKNKIEFSSRDKAINKGYVPCKRCNP